METTPFGYETVTPADVERARARADAVLLDVRTPEEYRARRIPGATLLPVQELPARWQELDPQCHTLCVCEHGVRSEAAAAFLADQGFARVATMRGGMACWPGPIERG